MSDEPIETTAPGGVRYRLRVGETPVCLDCGALVADTPAHDRFHAILGDHAKAIAVLVVSHISEAVHDRYDVRERIDAKGRNRNNWSAEAFREVTGTALVVSDGRTE